MHFVAYHDSAYLRIEIVPTRGSEIDAIADTRPPPSVPPFFLKKGERPTSLIRSLTSGRPESPIAGGSYRKQEDTDEAPPVEHIQYQAVAAERIT